MNRLFNWIGKLIEKHPFKVLLTTIIIFAVLITGVSKIKMETGNETLVQKDNPVYLSNQKMEETFGGDSILVLFTEDSEGNLLSHENIEKMWNVEKKFQYNDYIFSFMSPASIVHQITETQSTAIKDQVLTISDGLVDLSTKLTEIGTELNKKEVMNPEEISKKLENLSNSSEAFNQLIDGQKNMAAGALELQGGLYSIADGLGEVSGQLTGLSNLAGDNQELKMKLNAISENLNKSAHGIRTMGEKTTNIQAGANNTADALGKVSTQLKTETSTMKGSLSGGINPDELNEMAAGFITMGDNLSNIAEGLSTFHTKSSMMVADIPADQEELDNILYDEDNNLRTQFMDVILDNKNSLMVVKLQGNLDDEYKDQVAKELTTALDDEGFETVSYVVSGKPVLDTSLKSEMKTNMVTMVGSAVIIMLIVLAIVFKVKWRMLSLGIILVSVIATLGFMGYLSVPVTMVSMAVFPILIGLGIDYSIQFHNRYEEEKSVRSTVRNIGKPVAIAVLATVLGFISLYASPVPMIQDFGKMLTIGVIISFVGSILLLIPILHLKDKMRPEKEVITEQEENEIPQKDTFLNKLLKTSTKVVIKLSVPVLLIAIAASAIGFYSDNKVGVETNIESFMPQDMEALQDIRFVRDTVGSTDQMTLYLKDDDILKEENLDWIQKITKELEDKYTDTIVDIKSIDTLVSNLSTNEDLTTEEYTDLVDTIPKKQVNMFVNDERNESIILLNIKHLDTEALQTFLTELKSDLKDAPISVQITGKSVLDVEMVNGLTSGRVLMTMIGLVLVFVALLLVYRNLFKALIAILPVILIVGMSSGIMYLLGIDYTPITSTLGALVLGMGTEMTVMLMERYIEERELGKNKTDAIIHSVVMIGKAIVASGLTTVGGFSVLILSDFVILKDFGIMTVINISLALLSTFVILPPILTIFDRLLFSKKEIATIQEMETMETL